MNIYLVRHGEVEHNRLRYYSTEDEDLNENGIKQAYELKEKIADIDYEICYCSTLIRAKHTAEIINCKNKNIITIDRLTERNPKMLNGRPIDFTDREEYWKYDSKIDYGAETIDELFQRVFSFIDELKNVNYENVLIVAHSGVSKAFYAYFNGIPDDKKFLNLGLKNCEIKQYLL